MNSCVADRRESTPLYRQIRERLREQITSGRYQPGDLLPSERQLCGLHGVSHITARQALVDLTREGVVYRVRGKGTYVAEPSTVAEIGSVGLVIPEYESDTHSPFFADFLAGIKQAIGGQKTSLLIYTETEAKYVVDACRGRLSNVIFLVPHIKDRIIPMLAKESLPLVVVGETEEPEAYTVDNDNVAVGEMVAAHLLAIGRRCFGYIGGPPECTATDSRLKGYRQALVRAGVGLEDRRTRFGRYSAETGNRYACELAAEGATALFCADDMIAIGALNALHGHGLRIPEDVAVVGCNNSAFTRGTWPPLTTVEVSAGEIGRRSAEILSRVLRGETVPRRTIVPTKLIVRGSTVAAAAGDNEA